MSDRDEDVDRLLARGHPSGPRLDRLWERIEPRIPAEADGARRRWPRLAFALAPALALGLVAVLWIGGAQDPFRPRGAADSPVLEATCGAPAAPCAVGEALFLRVGAAPGGGVAYIGLIEGGAVRQVLGPFDLAAQGPTALPVELRPEERDRAAGIELRLLVVAGPLADPTAQIAGGSRLHLEVAK